MDLPIPPVLIPMADFSSYRESWHGDSPFPSKSFEYIGDDQNPCFAENAPLHRQIHHRTIGFSSGTRNIPAM